MTGKAPLEHFSKESVRKRGFLLSVFPRILEEVADSCERFGDLVDGSGIGTADVPFAAFAEGAAGNESDVLLDEQVLGKLFV